MRSGCPRDICSSGLGTEQQSLWVILARGSMLGSHSWRQPPQCLPRVVLTPCSVTSPLEPVSEAQGTDVLVLSLPHADSSWVRVKVEFWVRQDAPLGMEIHTTA